MAYELIPGFRQDHRGRTYQLAHYPNGKLIEVPVEEPKLSSEVEVNLTPVTVESHSRLTLNAKKEPDKPRNLGWVEKALEKGSLFKQGDTFQSLTCYQGRNT